MKAAETGKTGDPNLYRDFIIKPYLNKYIKSNVLYDVRSYSDDKVDIKILDNKEWV